jgi:hypothetical protein
MPATFATTFAANDILQLGSARPLIGTAVLGSTFGKITKFELERTGEAEELTDGAGGLRAHIIKKPGVTATIETCFDIGVSLPGLYNLITLVDLPGISARVMTGAKITYDDGKERKFSFTIQMWDSLNGEPAYRVATATNERFLLDIGIPVATATPGSGQIVVNWDDITDADTYKIQVSSDAGVTWANLATPTPSTYTHTVTTGQSRHYRVAAVDSVDGQGEYSAVVNATAS